MNEKENSNFFSQMHHIVKNWFYTNPIKCKLRNRIPEISTYNENSYKKKKNIYIYIYIYTQWKLDATDLTIYMPLAFKKIIIINASPSHPLNTLIF